MSIPLLCIFGCFVFFAIRVSSRCTRIYVRLSKAVSTDVAGRPRADAAAIYCRRSFSSGWGANFAAFTVSTAFWSAFSGFVNFLTVSTICVGLKGGFAKPNSIGARIPWEGSAAGSRTTVYAGKFSSARSAACCLSNSFRSLFRAASPIILRLHFFPVKPMSLLR